MLYDFKIIFGNEILIIDLNFWYKDDIDIDGHPEYNPDIFMFLYNKCLKILIDKSRTHPFWTKTY